VDRIILPPPPTHTLFNGIALRITCTHILNSQDEYSKFRYSKKHVAKTNVHTKGYSIKQYGGEEIYQTGGGSGRKGLGSQNIHIRVVKIQKSWGSRE